MFTCEQEEPELPQSTTDLDSDKVCLDFTDPYELLLMEIWSQCWDQWLTIGEANMPHALNLEIVYRLFETYEVNDKQDQKWLIPDLRAITQGFIDQMFKSTREK